MTRYLAQFSSPAASAEHSGERTLLLLEGTLAQVRVHVRDLDVQLTALASVWAQRFRLSHMVLEVEVPLVSEDLATDATHSASILALAARAMTTVALVDPQAEPRVASRTV